MWLKGKNYGNFHKLFLDSPFIVFFRVIVLIAVPLFADIVLTVARDRALVLLAFEAADVSV